MKVSNYSSCIALLVLMLWSCSKKETLDTLKQTETTAQAFKKSVAVSQLAARPTATETQSLIRKYNEWFLGRDISLYPFDDETGAKQYAAQPFSSGTMFLATGAGPGLQTRNVTIQYSQYQNIFLGLLGLTSWVNDCPPTSFLPNNKYPFGWFNSSTSGAFNPHNSALTLMWNGNSILPQKVADLQGNSGTWSFLLHPSWPGSCENPSLLYADGLHALLPLSLGTHHLEVSGSAYYPIYKFTFSYHVIYNINVVP